jgi:hypothetical protein
LDLAQIAAWVRIKERLINSPYFELRKLFDLGGDRKRQNLFTVHHEASPEDRLTEARNQRMTGHKDKKKRERKTGSR